jgi:Zn-finger nucleic acid-binding protein
MNGTTCPNCEEEFTVETVNESPIEYCPCCGEFLDPNSTLEVEDESDYE